MLTVMLVALALGAPQDIAPPERVPVTFRFVSDVFSDEELAAFDGAGLQLSIDRWIETYGCFVMPRGLLIGRDLPSQTELCPGSVVVPDEGFVQGKGEARAAVEWVGSEVTGDPDQVIEVRLGPVAGLRTVPDAAAQKEGPGAHARRPGTSGVLLRPSGSPATGVEIGRLDHRGRVVPYDPPAVTDGEGRWTLPKASGGCFAIVRRDGSRDWERFEIEPESVAFGAEGVELRLVPLFAAPFQLVRSDGQDPGDAHVTATRVSGDPRRAVSGSNRASLGFQVKGGNAWVESLIPGLWKFRVWRAQRPDVVVCQRIEPDQSITVRVGAHSAQAAGYVAASGGGPIARCGVRIIASDGTSGVVATNPYGCFEFEGLPAGPAVLDIGPVRCGDRLERLVTPVTAAARACHLPDGFQLRPASGVHLVVHDGHGAEIGLTAQLQDTETGLVVSGATMKHSVAGLVRRAIPAGRYRAVVRNGSGEVIASRMLNHDGLRERIVELVVDASSVGPPRQVTSHLITPPP